MLIQASMLVLLTILVSLSQSKPSCTKSYSGYKVVRLSHVGIEAIRTLEAEGFDILSAGKNSVDILVPPDGENEMYRFIAKYQGVEPLTIVEDLQEKINAERAFQRAAEAKHKNTKWYQSHRMDWDSYHSLDDMYEWFDYLEGMDEQYIPFVIFACSFFHSFSTYLQRQICLCEH